MEERREEFENVVRVLEEEIREQRDLRTSEILGMVRDYFKERAKNPNAQVVIRVSFLREEEILESFYEEGVAQDEDDWEAENL